MSGEHRPGAKRLTPRKAWLRALKHGLKRSLPLALVLMLAALVLSLGREAHAQRFVPQFALGGEFSTPEALGVTPDSPPPDLDEPEIGEDPETALFPPGEAVTSKTETQGNPARPPRAGPRFAGQRHEPFAPLPLGQRLRRVLRDSPLSGGHDFWFQRRPPTDVYFMAFESSAHDRFLSFGAKHAVRGTLNAPGWRFLSTLGVKVAAYDATLDARTSRVDLARMMPGYELRFGSLTLSAYAGLGYARSSATGIVATGRFGRWGGSALGEIWQDWSRLAPALGRFTAGYVMADGANRSAAVGLRHAFALPSLPVLIGPEASWSAGRDVRARGTNLHSAYRKQRLGLHASEIPLFAVRLRVSGGAEWRERHKPGGYAEMAAYLPY